VNNAGCPDFEGGQFAYGAIGRLEKVAAVAQKPVPEGTY
jgi:hypothetical protein